MSRYTVTQGRYPDSWVTSWCVLDRETEVFYPFAAFYTAAEAAEKANIGELDISGYHSDSAITYIPGGE